MFREKIAKMLGSDNPIANTGKEKENESTTAIEDFIKEKKGKTDEVPDFSSILKKKGLTKDESHDTIEEKKKPEDEKMDDKTKAIELAALKYLMEKYKGE